MSDKDNIEFCECKNSSSVYGESNDFGEWLVCSDCKKPVDGSFEYYEGFEDY